MENFKTHFESEQQNNEDEDIEIIKLFELTEKMMEFIEDNIDFELLNLEQKEYFVDILDEFEEFEDQIEDQIDEQIEDLNEISKIRKKIPKSIKRARARAYRKNKVSIKLKAKKFRKTAKFRKYKKKSKRFAKRGKTSTGKRQSRLI